MWEWLKPNNVIVSSVTIFIAYLAYRTSRQNLRIQQAREQEHIDAMKRAILKPELEHHWISGGYHLIIHNKGLCEARNVEIVIDGYPLNKHPNRIRPNATLKPATTIGAGMKIRLVFHGPLASTEPPRQVFLKWQDDSGNNNEINTELTVW
jgi:hypothetical protein